MASAASARTKASSWRTVYERFSVARMRLAGAAVDGARGPRAPTPVFSLSEADGLDVGDDVLAVGATVADVRHDTFPTPAPHVVVLGPRPAPDHVLEQPAYLPLDGYVGLAQRVVGIVSTTTGALMQGSCEAGMILEHGPINKLTVPMTWMKQTRSASFLTMKSVIHDNSAGEPGVLVDHAHCKLFSQRLAAGEMHKTYSMGPASFSISAGALDVHTATPIDIVLSKNHVISTILEIGRASCRERV